MQEVTVYTTPICGYCQAAKSLLKQRGYPFKEVDLAADPDLRMRLSRENGGYRTVPMIFIGTEFIGGFNELSALDRSGALAAKIGKA
jgi:glutaredoxin 3